MIIHNLLFVHHFYDAESALHKAAVINTVSAKLFLSFGLHRTKDYPTKCAFPQDAAIAARAAPRAFTVHNVAVCTRARNIREHQLARVSSVQ